MKSEQKVTETHGSPFLDVLVKIRGACPFNARASEDKKNHISRPPSARVRGDDSQRAREEVYRSLEAADQAT